MNLSIRSRIGSLISLFLVNLLTFSITLFGQSHADVGHIHGNEQFEFEIDMVQVQTHLAKAKKEFAVDHKGAETFLTLPDPFGQMREYLVENSPVMSAEGEQMYEYQSFKAIHPKSKEIVGRFSISKNGLTGVFQGVAEENGNPTSFFVRKKEGQKHIAEIAPGDDLQVGCEAHFHKEAFESNLAQKGNLSYGNQLRIFKIAMTNAGELAEEARRRGLDVRAVLADLVNQVNFIYESELSVRLEIVTPIKTFTSRSSDPFTTFSTTTLIQDARRVIEELYTGYDFHLGHLVTNYGGGRSYLNSVCGNLKSGAVSGTNIPLSDTYLRLFAHEVGHQFGAGHSFNSVAGNCRGNLFTNSAYEIGSGSTIMSYAGYCSGENVSSSRSRFFNVGAIGEMESFISNLVGNGCGRLQNTFNSPPSVQTEVTKTIPANTPFMLKGWATDANRDAMTYSWEQFDLGPSGLLGIDAAQDANSVLFKVMNPTNEAERMIPELDAILNEDNVAKFEILPQVSRDVNFCLTARDAKGGVGSQSFNLKVHNTGKAFKINSFNAAQNVIAGSTVSVRWEVASTNRSPIFASSVDILLSLDDGKTFPIKLVENTPNDGIQSVRFPVQSATSARIMIKPKTNIFFDINNAPIRIINGPTVPPCSISDIQYVQKTGCYDNGTITTSDDYFFADVIVSFENKPRSGNLILSGNGVNISNPTTSDFNHRFNNVRLSANGSSLNFTAYFSADSQCSYSEFVGYAPQPCSMEPTSPAYQMTFYSAARTYELNKVITFDVSLSNTGDGVANNVKVSIPDLTGRLIYSASNTFKGYVNAARKEWVVGTLAPGETVSLKYEMTPKVSTGDLLVRASLVGENLTKQVVLSPNPVVNQQTDLGIAFGNVPTKSKVGEVVVAGLTIHNFGTTTISSPYKIGLYLSNDRNLSSDDLSVGKIAKATLSLGSEPMFAGFYLSPNIAAGDYFLLARVDDDFQIVESNESNNQATIPFLIESDAPTLPCTINTSISNKRCHDNQTPSDPSDHTFSFSLTFGNQGSDAGWQANVGGLSRAGEYGDTQIFGPFRISNGAVNVQIRDLADPTCISNLSVNPVSTCSKIEVPDVCQPQSEIPWHEWIAMLRLGDFLNISGKSTYSNFSSRNINLEIGKVHSFSVTAGFSYETYEEYVSIWMDFNGNGSFETSEQVVRKTIIKPESGTSLAALSGQIFIPTFVESRKVQMRVILSRDGFSGPCEDVLNGEVEDYLVNLTAGKVAPRGANDEPFDFSVYPNPTNDFINIKSAQPIYSSQLFNEMGQLILSHTNQQQFSIAHLPEGIYFLKVMTESDAPPSIRKVYILDK